MGNGITQFTSFVDGTWSFGGDVAGNPRGGELLEQSLHACRILGNVGVVLAIGAF
jgi:hypothetical protein